MQGYSFKRFLANHTLFYKRDNDDITLLLVYVNDMIVTGNNTPEIEKIHYHLMKEFERKNLKALKYFLGIEVSQSKRESFLSMGVCSRPPS